VILKEEFQGPIERIDFHAPPDEAGIRRSDGIRDNTEYVIIACSLAQLDRRAAMVSVGEGQKPNLLRYYILKLLTGPFDLLSSTTGI
jgi:hypothetical protein